MHTLAAEIRNQSTALAKEYAQGLQAISTYAELSAQHRLEIALEDLDLIAACLETGDDTPFIQFTRTRAGERQEQGFPTAALMQALLALEETLWPLVTTVETATFLWRMLSQTRNNVAQRVAETLEEQRAFLRQVIDINPNFIFVKDREGRYVLANQALAEAYGTTTTDIIGKTDMDFNVARAEDFRRDDLKVMDSLREKFIPEDSSVDEAGNTRWLQTIKRPLVDENGVAQRVLGVVTDITARKQVEEELRLLSRAVNAAHDAVIITDLRGDIQFVNPAFEQITGYNQAEALGQNMNILNSGRHPEAFYGQMWQVISSGQVWQGQVTNRRRDGTLYEAQLTISPVRSPAGEIEQYVSIQQDISERKRMEQEIQESLERRGRQVQTGTEIAQEIAAAPALDELFRRVVTLIKERFNYYHAQIFRYEPALDTVVLVVGYGEIGQQMLAAGHQLEPGRGVAGTAVATGRSVLVSDATQDPDWVPNPFLPDSKGELAVPIKLRDSVLGILDVQSDTTGALTADDQLLLEGLCGQIAIAIGNTRLRQEMEESLRELSSMQRAMSRAGWEGFRETAALPDGYLFDRTEIRPADDLWAPEIELAAESGALVPPARSDQHSAEHGLVAASPMQVYDETIGVLGVYDDPQHPLSANELALVESVSEQVALALESARLFEEARARAEQMATLNEMSRALAAMLNVEAVVESIQHYISRLMDATSLYIALYDPENEKITFPLVIQEGQRVQWQSRRLGRGLTEHVIHTCEPLLIPENVTQELARLGIELVEPQAQSWLGVPMMIGPLVTGVVAVQSYTTPRPYNEQQCDLLSAIATQAAIAIENARLFEQAEAALAQTEELYRASAELSAAQSYDDVLTALRTHTLLGQADRVASIELFDRPWVDEEWPEWLTVVARWPQLPQSGQRYLLRDYASFFAMLRPDESMIVTDATTDPRLDEHTRTLFSERFQARSVISLPLTVGGQWIGYVNAQYSEPTQFPETEVRRLTTLYAQAAVVVQSLRQLAETQARAQRERQLREITNRLRTPPDVDGVMRALVQELGQVLGRRACVQLGQHTGAHIRTPPPDPRGGE